MTGLPRPVAPTFATAAARERRRRMGQGEHAGRERRRDRRRQRRSRRGARRSGPLGRRPRLGDPQAGRRTEQQDAGQAAADGGLGERHVDGVEAHPDERQQQAVGDESDDRGEGVAGDDRPDGDGQDQHRQTHVDRWHHVRRRRLVAPRGARDELGDRGAGQQDQQPDADELERRRRALPARGSRPSTTRPRPRLSALVSACRRVSVSGKRSRPTVPARKKNAPAETATIVKMSSATLIRRPASRVRRPSAVSPS